MTSIAKALIQWVTRTQAGWMTACVGAAEVTTASWVASIDMARLLQVILCT
jgi:hypothetical protein